MPDRDDPEKTKMLSAAWLFRPNRRTEVVSGKRMNTDTPVEKIRQAILGQLTKMGVNDASRTREAMLVQNGFYCGRKFQCDEFEVVWFLEEDEIKFFNPQGDLLLATSAVQCLEEHQAEIQTTDRKAA